MTPKENESGTRQPRRLQIKSTDLGGWLAVPRLDIAVPRCEPRILDLDGAVAWIKEHRPILWTGSILSVPAPSAIPAGAALQRELFRQLFPNSLDGGGVNLRLDNLDEAVEYLLPRWPLERLLDEHAWLDPDAHNGFLTAIWNWCRKGRPNPLHRAVVKYYERGLAAQPLCVTVNWDSFQEQAFRRSGHRVVSAGPGKKRLEEGFGKSLDGSIFVYHPHGSFAARDAVCSLLQEQVGFQFQDQIIHSPVLFLGYSGYEPSLYRELHRITPQLWCIRDAADWDVPAKRRLLSRPDVSVFVGDLRDLLVALELLDAPVELQCNRRLVRDGRRAEEQAALASGIFASLDPSLNARMLGMTLLSFHDEPEAIVRYGTLMRSLTRHLVDHRDAGSILTALGASSSFYESKQVWLSVLAYWLRRPVDVSPRLIERIFSKIASVPPVTPDLSSANLWSGYDDVVFSRIAILLRQTGYERFLGRDAGPYLAEEENQLAQTDLSLGGEFLEMHAWNELRTGRKDGAAVAFDQAATSHYLNGLWHAGQLTEWASTHLDDLPAWDHPTLFLPGPPAGPGSLPEDPVDSGGS